MDDESILDSFIFDECFDDVNYDENDTLSSSLANNLMPITLLPNDCSIDDELDVIDFLIFDESVQMIQSNDSYDNKINNVKAIDNDVINCTSTNNDNEDEKNLRKKDYNRTRIAELQRLQRLSGLQYI